MSEPARHVRKSKGFWIANEGCVSYEIGYECPPNDGVYWFPKLGFSWNGGLASKSEAIKKAKSECRLSIKIWTKRLNKLNAMLKEREKS